MAESFAAVAANSQSPARARWVLAVEVAMVFAIALAARLAFDNPTVHFDELYHVLAARATLESGQPIIADGTLPYDRGMIFTWLVMASFACLGESIFAARVPSMILGALLVVTLYGWMRHRTGRLAALLGAAMVAFSPEALDLSAFSRFYMMQALFIMLGAACVYTLMERFITGTWRFMSSASSILLAVIVVVSAWVALQLQSTTLIAMVNVGLWSVGVMVWRLESLAKVGQRGRWVLAAAGAASAVALGMWLNGHMHEMWHEYRLIAFWAMDTRDDVAYYARHLWTWYTPLVVLSPVLMVLAVRRWPLPASFALVVGLLGLLLHSFAGFKAMRYAFWAMPFLYAAWGMGLAESIRLVHGGVCRLAQRRAPATRPWATAVVALAAVALLAYGSHRTYAFYLIRGMLTGQERNNPFSRPDWAAARATLEPIADSVDAVVASASTKAIYYLGDADAVVSVTERGRGEEAAIDWRTGVRLIAEAQSLQEIMDREPTGLIIVEDDHWRQQWFVPDEVADVIESRAVPVALPKDCRLLAFRWGPTSMHAQGQ